MNLFRSDIVLTNEKQLKNNFYPQKSKAMPNTLSNVKITLKQTVQLNLNDSKELEIATGSDVEKINLNDNAVTIWVDGDNLKIGTNQVLDAVYGSTVYPKADFSQIEYSVIGASVAGNGVVVDNDEDDYLIVGTEVVREGRSISAGAVTIATQGDTVLVTYGNIV